MKSDVVIPNCHKQLCLFGNVEQILETLHIIRELILAAPQAFIKQVAWKPKIKTDYREPKYTQKI